MEYITALNHKKLILLQDQQDLSLIGFISSSK